MRKPAWGGNLTGGILPTSRAERDRLVLEARQAKPVTKREVRAARQEEDRQQAEEAERQAKESITMADFFEKFYLTRAGLSEKYRKDDRIRFRLHLAPGPGRQAHAGNRSLGPGAGEKADDRSRPVPGHGAPRPGHRAAVLFKGHCLGHGPRSIPTKTVKMPKLNNMKLRELSAEEEARLLDALRSRSKQTWAMALVSLYSGMRFAEIAGLTWQCIDFSHDLICVRGKGDRSRTIPMHHVVKELLLERRSPECEPTDLIFPAKGGGQQARISALYYRVVEELALNENRERRWRVDFHTLRHSWGSRAARLVPITDVRDILGHSTLAMTTRYAKGNLERAAVALQSLGQEESNGATAVVPLKESNSP